jgi:aldehyde dehydrogenase (NAD+)
MNKSTSDTPIFGACTGTNWIKTGGTLIKGISPIDGSLISSFRQASGNDYEKIVKTACIAFQQWRQIPTPVRGEMVRQIGDAVRKNKESLGRIISFETGKIYPEGLGEVQEMIDICDFATGLSRQLYGLSMHSERPEHRMYEQYHPLGPVGIITAFNFPLAVWAWNAMIAMVCGDVVLWKPSEKASLTAIAIMNIMGNVLKKNNVPEGVCCLITGDYKIGELLCNDSRIPLVSATGSVAMGKKVAATVGKRLGRTLLELGGNNAIIITPEADLKLAVTAVLFGAVGTAGQRCTSTRRLIIHESIYEKMRTQLLNSYKQVPIGNPLDKGILMGPLIDKLAVTSYVNAIQKIKEQGGKIAYGGKVLNGKGYENGLYVMPTLAEVKPNLPIIQQETFAPILYLMKYKTLEEAIALHNAVPQGLSSAIFSKNIKETEKFLSVSGSDCGIANVNIGTSGAEIGGAFGGEKETGGGRESGSDSWKAYMRRQTTTINYGSQLPLAQGINFAV